MTRRDKHKNSLDTFDLFSKDVQSFNLEGRRSIHSILGLITTALVWLIVFVCFIVKTIEVGTGSNPKVSVIYQEDAHLDEKSAIDLSQSQFAFAVRNFLDDDFKSAHYHVNWQAQIIEGDGLTEQIKHRIGTHICTQNDWEKFHTPANRDKSKIQKLKTRNVMYCLDSEDKEGNSYSKKLFGEDDQSQNRRLEINFVTCDPAQQTSKNFDQYESECIVDKASQKLLDKKLKETLDYLGEADLIVIYNDEQMNMEGYGENTVQKESRILNRQVNKNSPHQFNGVVHNDQTVDTTAFTHAKRHSNQRIETSGPFPSKSRNYPEQYKITGYQVNISSRTKVTRRSNIDMLEVFGWLAGLMIFIRAIFSLIVPLFTDFSASQLLANRLYVQKIPESLINRKKLDKVQSEDQVKAESVLPYIPVIDYMDLQKFAYTFKCRCRNRDWYQDYTKSLTQVNSEITSDLDIVKFMRRLRAHGLALSMVTDPKLLDITNRLSRTKVLDTNKWTQDRKLWQIYEDTSYKEKLVLAFVKRLVKVTHFEEIESRFLIEKRKNLLKAPVNKLTNRGMGATETEHAFSMCDVSRELNLLDTQGFQITGNEIAMFTHGADKESPRSPKPEEKKENKFSPKKKLNANRSMVLPKSPKKSNKL